MIDFLIISNFINEEIRKASNHLTCNFGINNPLSLILSNDPNNLGNDMIIDLSKQSVSVKEKFMWDNMDTRDFCGAFNYKR